MEQLIRSVAKELQPQVKEKQIAVELVFAKKNSLIETDPQLMRMIVQNLLSNAVKYTPRKGKISCVLELDQRQKRVLLTVSDNGCGIPTKDQAHIFDKLFRADNAREKDSEGAGLGLYIVKAVIDLIGGKIWFESEENKGTTFYLTLPLVGVKKPAEVLINQYAK